MVSVKSNNYPLGDFSFILITCLLDNVMISQGEITYWSLLGVKGLKRLFEGLRARPSSGFRLIFDVLKSN